jgi:hypothetical protein
MPGTLPLQHASVGSLHGFCDSPHCIVDQHAPQALHLCVTRYLNAPEFQEGLFRMMTQRIYSEMRGVAEDKL